MRIRHVIINGCCVSIYNTLKDEKTRGPIAHRKLVSPTFVELWYKICDDKFDYMLWSALTQSEKDYMAECVNMTHTICQEFQIALAKATKSSIDRLRLLEGEIVAGNLNPALVKEFSDLLDHLSASRQIPPIQAGRLKKRIQRTYAEQLKNAS